MTNCDSLDLQNETSSVSFMAHFKCDKKKKNKKDLSLIWWNKYAHIRLITLFAHVCNIPSKTLCLLYEGEA